MDEISKAYHNFQQIGMVKQPQNNFYTVDPTEFKVKTDRLETVLKAEYAIARYNEFKHEIDKFVNDMLELQIPEDDMETYLRSNDERASIRHYKDIKNKLRYALVEQNESNNPNYGDLAEFKSNASQRQSNTKRKVLNKNNPFADITITNQQFLYRDGEEYKTLAFTTGHTLTKLSVNDTEILALQPGFKITKTNERLRVFDEAEITMDDTITTPLPDTSGDLELIYI